MIPYGCPKGFPAVGDLAEVRNRATSLHYTGRVVAVIKSMEQPDKTALEPFFRVQATSTALYQQKVPARPSKWPRYVIEIRPGRAFVAVDDLWTTIKVGDSRNVNPALKP